MYGVRELFALSWSLSIFYQSECENFCIDVFLRKTGFFHEKVVMRACLLPVRYEYLSRIKRKYLFWPRYTLTITIKWRTFRICVKQTSSSSPFFIFIHFTNFSISHLCVHIVHSYLEYTRVFVQREEFIVFTGALTQTGKLIKCQKNK